MILFGWKAKVNVFNNDKNKLRQRFIDLLRKQNVQDRLVKSRLIQEKLFERPEFVSAQTILFYASFDGEVETFPMMKQATQLKKTIALPVINKGSKNFIPTRIKDMDQLHDGPFGIKQPVLSDDTSIDTKDLDLVIVPGLAFDKCRNRLGRGAGYYDRFLAQLPDSIPALGLAFDFQLVDLLPHVEPHDRILTDVIVN